MVWGYGFETETCLIMVDCLQSEEDLELVHDFCWYGRSAELTILALTLQRCYIESYLYAISLCYIESYPYNS